MEKIFFDTDCLSAFLWVNEEPILPKLYPGRIVVPTYVRQEISRVPNIFNRLNMMSANKQIAFEGINVGTEEYNDFVEMTTNPQKGMKIIGKGEAACIALAKKHQGIIASNNLKDIMPYVTAQGIENITTAEIMVKALNNKLITEDQGNQIWNDMLNKNRMLPMNW